MKEWSIPVSWEVCGMVKIKANTLEEAIHIAVHDDSIELPYGEYVDGSFDVTVDDDELIREAYNAGQKDDITDNEAILRQCGFHRFTGHITKEQHGSEKYQYHNYNKSRYEK